MNTKHHINRYPIILITCSVIILSGHTTSFAIQDDCYSKANDKGYVSASQYGPGWVSTSVLDTGSRQKMQDDAQRLNDIEAHNAALSNANKKNNDSDVVLQKKKSGSGLPSAKPVVIDTTAPTTIPRGSGADWLDKNGKATDDISKMYAEKIGGKYYVWAGYDNPDTLPDGHYNATLINDAIKFAKGLEGTGNVLVREGEYDAREEDCHGLGSGGHIVIQDGVSVFGGYDSDGFRDIAKDSTTINWMGGNGVVFQVNYITKHTEISGFNLANGIEDPFTYTTPVGFHVYDSSNVTIANNTISDGFLRGINITGQHVPFHSILVENNIVLSYNSMWAGEDYKGRSDIIVKGNTFGWLYLLDANLDATVEDNVFLPYYGLKVTSESGFNINVDSINNNFVNSAIITGGHVHISSTDDYFYYEPGLTEELFLVIDVILAAGNYNASYQANTTYGALDVGAIAPGLNDAGFSSTPDPKDNPVYTGPNPSNITNSTKEQTSGTNNPSYYPDKLDFDYNLSYDQYENMDNNKNLSDTVTEFTGFLISLNEFSLVRHNQDNAFSNVDLGKFKDSYIYALGDKLNISFDDKTPIDETILILENKKSRTDMEESLLEIAKLLEDSSQNMDEVTLKEFNQIVTMVEMVEDMKYLMNPGDLDAISKSLKKLVEDEHNIYNDYLKSTEKIYENLMALLAIDITEVVIPNEYTELSRVNTIAKKKIAVDLTIERLKAKDETTLKDNEKEALKAYADILGPMKEEYLSRIKMAMATFTWGIKDILKNKNELSIVSGKSDLKALFVLDYSNKLTSTTEKSNPKSGE